MSFPSSRNPPEKNHHATSAQTCRRKNKAMTNKDYFIKMRGLVDGMIEYAPDLGVREKGIAELKKLSDEWKKAIDDVIDASPKELLNKEAKLPGSEKGVAASMSEKKEK